MDPLGQMFSSPIVQLRQGTDWLEGSHGIQSAFAKHQQLIVGWHVCVRQEGKTLFLG